LQRPTGGRHPRSSRIPLQMMSELGTRSMALKPGWAAVIPGSLALMLSCSPTRPPAPAPLFRTPEGAALCTVVSRQAEKKARASVVNLFLIASSTRDSVLADLTRCLRVKALTFSRAMFGGGVASDSILQLDLRASEEGNCSPGTERSPGHQFEAYSDRLMAGGEEF
jgi:hypothetical protein